MINHKLNLFADYFQVYLLDDDANKIMMWLSSTMNTNQ